MTRVLFIRFGRWQGYGQRSPATGRSNRKLSSELLGPFAHPQNAHAKPDGSGLFRGQGGGKTPAAVHKLQTYFALPALQFHQGRRTARVPVNIAEAFLDDAEQGHFNVARETAERGGNIELEFDPGALPEAGGIRLQRAGEAEFFQKRRGQP